MAYFEERLHTSPWDDATPADKIKALATATRMVDLLDFIDLPDPVPDDIKIACCEIALALLDGVDPEVEEETARVTSQRYVGISTTYDRSGVGDHVMAGIPSATAWKHLMPYLREDKTIKLSRVS